MRLRSHTPGPALVISGDAGPYSMRYKKTMHRVAGELCVAPSVSKTAGIVSRNHTWSGIGDCLREL